MALKHYDLSNVAPGTRVRDLPEFEKVRINSPVVVPLQGRMVMQSHLTYAQREPKGGERCEVQLRGSRLGKMGEIMRYGFAVYLPDDFTADDIWELVAQWYPEADHADEIGRQPTLSLHTANGQWLLTGKHSPDVNTPINHPSIRTYTVWEAPHTAGTWNAFYFEVLWTHLAHGFVRVWKDGVRVADYNGPTSYNDQTVPSLKLGIYKGWQQMALKGIGPSPNAERTVYHDQMRVGDKDSSYEEVAPRIWWQDTSSPEASEELRAEIERLTAANESLRESLDHSERALAVAENERDVLRARLETIRAGLAAAQEA